MIELLTVDPQNGALPARDSSLPPLLEPPQEKKVVPLARTQNYFTNLSPVFCCLCSRKNFFIVSAVVIRKTRRKLFFFSSFSSKTFVVLRRSTVENLFQKSAILVLIKPRVGDRERRAKGRKLFITFDARMETLILMWIASSWIMLSGRASYFSSNLLFISSASLLRFWRFLGRWKLGFLSSATLISILIKTLSRVFFF